MRASKLLKLPVMAMREGLEQGQVIDMVVDPEKKKVSHYIVRKGSRYDLLLIAASDIRGIGTGFLVVPDSTVVRRIFGDPRRMEVVSRGFYLTDAQVISEAGIALGGIVDYDFDPRSCIVGTLILENGAQYPASQIVGLSGTTVFVSGTPSKAGAAAPQRTASQNTAARPSPAPVPVPPQMTREHMARDKEPLIVTPTPTVSAPVPAVPTVQQPASSSTRPAPAVPAQVRNAYRPESIVPERKFEREREAAGSGDDQMVKPPNVLRRLLVGKRLADDVASADGIFMLPAGTLITEWHMQLAEQHDAVQQLMKHVEPG